MNSDGNLYLIQQAVAPLEGDSAGRIDVADASRKGGRALRAAQIAALKARKADVRAATDAHRKALAAAVTRAQQQASHAGVHPNADQLARMLETLSLAAEPASNAGRFVDVIG